jgi:hypothetical protein
MRKWAVFHVASTLQEPEQTSNQTLSQLLTNFGLRHPLLMLGQAKKSGMDKQAKVWGGV